MREGGSGDLLTASALDPASKPEGPTKNTRKPCQGLHKIVQLQLGHVALLPCDYGNMCTNYLNGARGSH